ncbi:polyketide synthase [Lecanosticta acicola]|uniref:Polyketide synthase n=1 Tax=Lecanosticta acicola TaxID=111012 RepID=A0AAI8Z440_9PEZI|nr:polyketide synthase [Lecanosticta acicola]
MAPMMMSTEPSTGSTTPSSTSSQGQPPASSEPIAICGLACRLPGGSNTPSKFWDLLAAGKSGKCDVPQSRFNVDGFYHPDGSGRPGSMFTKGGYFLQDDIREFENSLFGISNVEATYMDPQQRKLLEVVFECLENAGIPLEQASGSNTGVYVGNFTFDFISMQVKEPDYMSRYSATGLGTTILGNRISHVFNLLGPSMVIDTACSSSLYCLHMAATALENYECDAAVVAGANLIQSAEQHIATMKAGVLSPTSECHVFDASADGYGRGDGIGALYLKRLRDAVRDGDAIRSVILGSAINANGKTSGISLPLADGQEKVIRKAMAKAAVIPDDIVYLECHGTGTKVGDAIEVEALSRVFASDAGRQPLLIGSVKSNVGHSEAASGISSVIKSTMALEKRQIPPTHGVKNINPKLKLDERNIDIPLTLTAMPGVVSKLQPKRIGINSFGYGGANAHVILEEASSDMYRDASIRDMRSSKPQSLVVLPLSAASTQSLEARIQDYAAFDFKDTDLRDLAFTLGTRRSQMLVRGYLLASPSDAISDSFKNGTFVKSPATVGMASAPFAFVFTGQGSQWSGMCRELLPAFPIVRTAIEELDQVLQSLPHAPKWTLQEAILNESDATLIHLPERSQPCCTAVQIVLIQLLASWGITPDTTIGHSSGEIAAAFAAGHISSAEAITAAYYRGYCASGTAKNGAMMAVGLSEEKANEVISSKNLVGQARVACINAPEGVTVSGDREAIAELLEVLKGMSVFARELKTGGQAYHSHHMLEIGGEYQSLLEKVLPTLPRSTRLNKGPSFVSSVDVEPKTTGFTPSYWRSNLERQVRFAPAIQEVHRHCFIEIGPHPSLELPIKQSLAQLQVPSSEVLYAAPLRRNTSALETALGLAGNLWLKGYNVDWTKVNGLNGSAQGIYNVVTDLPPYRFSYENTLWNECRSSVEYRNRKHLRHELLGSLMTGGNGRDHVFRNVLKVDDVSWLKDHKLQDDVVFPGAGYLAMAMEAITQVTDADRSKLPSFSFSNVNITMALSLPQDQTTQTEMFTTLRQSKLTNAATSAAWWDFTVSTYQDAGAVHHASGSISINPNGAVLQSKYQAPEGTLEPSAKRVWYEKFTKVGLNYGPTFQSISDFQTPSMKTGLRSGATVPLLTTCGDAWSQYPIHPITIDAMIQLGIMALTSGTPKKMRAQVPTRIPSLTVHTSAPYSDKTCQMNSVVRSTGFGSSEAGVEMVASDGKVLAQFDDLRLAPYHAGLGSDEERRHPMLRVLWKPDVYGLGLMRGEDMEVHAQKFADEANSPVSNDGLLKLGAIIDLVVHKNPRGRILELGNESNDLTVAVLDLLAYRTDFKRFATYTTAAFDASGALVGGPVNLETNERSKETSAITEASADIVIIPNVEPSMKELLPKVVEAMDDNAIILAVFPESADKMVESPLLSCVSCPVNEGQGSLVALRKHGKPHRDAFSKSRFLIVEQEETKLGVTLHTALDKVSGKGVSRVLLRNLVKDDVPSGTHVFNLCEATSPLLATISDEDMDQVKLMTQNASSLVWVTNGNILEGGHPEYGLVSGLSRAIMLEQPALKFYTFDIDQPEEGVDLTAERLISVLNQSAKQSSRMTDFEFVQRRGVVHVSRFTPDDEINQDFRNKQGFETTQLSLKDAKNVRLAIGYPGQFDTIYYLQQESAVAIGPEDVRIKVANVGVNAKDYYVLAGRVDTPGGTCQLECAGTVEAVGSEVSAFAPGDRVVVMAPSHFQTYQTVPSWACHHLLPTESFEVCTTLPLVYATAIYALHNRGNLKSGESVLIHSGAGGVGMAAIQIAQNAGAEVFTTVSTPDKKRFLVERYGVKESNIFSSRDTSFLADLLEATNGRGVDVIINSLTGDQLHATWKCAAPFGRFVEIGKVDLTTAGRLEMDNFLRNTTFTAFDLSNLYHSGAQSLQDIWRDLLRQVMTLYREGKIGELQPVRSFDISEMTQAMRYFASRSRMGKVVISMADETSMIPVQKLKHDTVFDANKAYVMVGCLGGLGRTLSRWMIKRGAKKFAFLGRSGTDKPAARQLIEDLEQSGAECVVIRGDVCSADDVQAVVAAAAAQGPVGGVVQAAMGLNEAIFSNMSNKYWHTGIDPKVQGTWHLYNSLKAVGGEGSLDFFLFTSSVSGSVGTATESNYCAANHVLDQFARYLRRQGLPAVSVGLGMISEVGYLHDNPEIEALLLRRGIQAIDADELVQLIDFALSSSKKLGIHHAHDDLAASHLLTGLEAFGLKELRKQGFEGSLPTMDDPRAAILASAVEGDGDGSAGPVQSGRLPVEVAKEVEAGASLHEAVLNHIRRRFGNLVLMKYDAVNVQKALADYGMDSMIAAEFRTWFYQNLAVDIPLLLLLGQTCTLETLRDLAVTELEKEEEA